jgi:hypothetical protein
METFITKSGHSAIEVKELAYMFPQHGSVVFDPTCWRVYGKKFLLESKVVKARETTPFSSSNATSPSSVELTSKFIPVVPKKGGPNHIIIDKYIDLQTHSPRLQALFESDLVVALDVEYSDPLNLELLQLAFESNELVHCFIFDITSIKKHLNGKQALKELFQKMVQNCVCIVHDGRLESFFLRSEFDLRFSKVIDTQLLCEYLYGLKFVGMHKILEKACLSHPLKSMVHGQMESGNDKFKTRPISDLHLRYAALDVICLLEALKFLLPPPDKAKTIDEEK